MNNSIGTNEICVNDLSFGSFAINLADHFGITTFEDMSGNSLSTSSVQKLPNHSFGEFGSRNHMSKQSGTQQFVISQNGVQSVSGNLLECRVGRSENGEWTFALKCFN